MATDAEILAAIDSAIVDILQNGQEITVDGTIYNKANLSKLFEYREKFMRKTTTSDNFFSRMKTGIPHR